MYSLNFASIRLRLFFLWCTSPQFYSFRKDLVHYFWTSADKNLNNIFSALHFPALLELAIIIA